MTTLELTIVIFGALAAFWVFVWVGELISKTPKIFYYGKFRKFLK